MKTTNGTAPLLMEPETARYTKDQLAEAHTFDREQMAAAVGMYYGIQKLRVGARNKESAHERSTDILADPVLITEMKQRLERLERESARVLREFAQARPLGRWAMSIAGVDAVIAAGLLAHIDVARAQTAGAIWRFAGLLDPKLQPWERGQKRPWNARLKTLCYKLGESFKKLTVSETSLNGDDDVIAEKVLKEHADKGIELSGTELLTKVKAKRARAQKRASSLQNDNYLYVRLYSERKQRETQRNDAGLFREQALGRLELAKRKGLAISPDQKKLWADGRLQPVGVDRRAARYAVTIFLSHYHQIGREILGLPMPKPWVLEHGGHVHYIPPPCWPVSE